MLYLSGDDSLRNANNTVIPIGVACAVAMSDCSLSVAGNSHVDHLQANTAQDKTAAELTKNGFIFSNPTRKLPIVYVKEALAAIAGAHEEVEY